MPGNSIYAIASINSKSPSSAYKFEGFRIYQYDAEMNRTELNAQDLNEGNQVLFITDEMADKELSVEPIGIYETRTIKLRDYYTDDEGEHELSGSWTVSDKQYTNGKAEINPIASYIVSYDWDSSEYFYVSSSPESFYVSNEDGIVIFKQQSSADETKDYSVELHKYDTVSLPTSETRTVTIDGEEQNVLANDTFEICGLKYGDKITLETNKEWPELRNCKSAILQSEDSKANDPDDPVMYEYTLIYPQKGSEFIFDPAEYTYEHGTVIFTCFGEEVKSVQYLAPESTIYYEQGSADDGYILKSGKIIVEDENSTRKALNGIHFIPEVKTTVELQQPKYGGTIHYYVDGKEIKTTSYQTSSGTEIEMKFVPWEGWIANYENGETYTVGTEKTQIATINRKDVDTAFIEDNEHKPLLTVSLAQSIGKNMKVSVSASGISNNSYQYDSKIPLLDTEIIKDKSIGTEDGINLSMSGIAIQKGTAIKITIKKVGEDKYSSNKSETVKSNEYRLVTNLVSNQNPIEIYKKSERENSPIWYKTINIKIEIVNVRDFNTPTEVQDATVQVKNEETGKNLMDGNPMELNGTVIVTIKPKMGYYITGSSVKNGIYQKSMKYEDYLKNIEKIIKEHKALKYYTFKLPSTDEYGAFTYKLDGESVYGTVKAKEGQKLTCEYVITKAGYKIENASGFIFNIGTNDQKQTKSITIDDNFNKETINSMNRESFGIKVVKGN